jgi:hypothetical protein
MNNTTKIILGIAAGAVVLCLCVVAGGFLFLRTTGSILSNAVETDPDETVKVSGSIAEYTVPGDFKTAYTTSIADFSLVAYTGEDEHSHIYFFQLPAGVHMDQAEIEKQLQQAAGSQKSDWNVGSEVVDQVPATICGQETTLVVSEGVNHEGQAFRQVTGVFQGRGGQAMVVFERPVDQWDQTEVDEFIASIH